ncbi:hypothetical protein ACJRO7_010548 [Eucalyptus globulus]|uniref:Uncharacterized protein n=1 Tax=Eucalyptus globulus TaxID=34317 RepID=A0ABD3LCB4_EUCGL
MGRREHRTLVQVPWRIPRRGSLRRRGRGPSAMRSLTRIPGVDGDVGLSPPSPLSLLPVLWSFCWAGFDNDPSAGSPTETLLRLLLPRNDKVQWTSRDVIGGEPPTSPRSEHFTGPFNR